MHLPLPQAATRRRFLEIGTLGALGIGWADLLHAAETGKRQRAASAGRFGQARSCVVIFLWGGPGQQDLWDLKPEAPAEARGEFQPIATRVAGVQISNQLPRLALQADKFTIVRSVSHRDFEHGSAAYTALTGHPHPQPGTNTPASPDDFPTYGSVVSRLRPAVRPVPDAVVLGPVMHQGNRPPLAGQNAGFLGPGYDPFRIADDPNEPAFQVEGLSTPDHLSLDRLAARHQLLSLLDERAQALRADRSVAGMGSLYERAFGLLRSQQTQHAFDLNSEKPQTRDCYGRTRFGQTLLLARRLVEAEVPLVTINWSKQNADQWDTHKQNYRTLRKLLPVLDQGLAAFLEDLGQRGLLETTLVVCLGEFGRTPRMNDDAGRDHWPDCYSVVLGGGGIRTGEVLGASNRLAAYPVDEAVAPWDIAATIYHCLGIDPATHVHDRQGRPFAVAPGRVIRKLLA